MLADLVEDPNIMSDQDRQEWSRHFDTLQWGVIAIFTAGVGALLSMSYSEAAQWWPECCGLALIVIGVFYVTGFRAFRSRLHGGIRNKGLRDFLCNPGPRGLPHMWDIFVVTFLAVGILFSFRLGKKLGYVGPIFSVSVIALSLALGYLWRVGKSEA